MPFALVIRIALRALARNTLCSLLTTLGISIGVGAFICSVAVGQGAARRWRVVRGTVLSHDVVPDLRTVCILGQTVVANLFGTADPVGQTLRVQRIPCQVVGVLQGKGQSLTGQDQDDVLLMPFSTVQ